MHGEGIVALFIPITISLGAFLMIWGIRYLENKENMALIERGLPIKRRRQADPSRTLKNSLMFIGAGLGLLLALLLTRSLHMSQEDSVAVFFALIAIFGGLGMLGAYMYERKNPPVDPEA
ncbi:MAG: hypothetical protein IT260_22825 [Saprospiraceae bacterium]|nr:hypothetical protein [Saprospiraceae bacterium]